MIKLNDSFSPSKLKKINQSFGKAAIEPKKAITSSKSKLPAFLTNIISRNKKSENLLEVPKLMKNFDSVNST